MVAWCVNQPRRAATAVAARLYFVFPMVDASPSTIQRAPQGAGRLTDACYVDLPSHRDARGVLTAVESGQDVPFDIKRLYLVHDIVADRGGHAHRDTTQVVTAVSGRCDLVLTDGTDERTLALEHPARGVLIGPMLFIRMTNFTPGTVVLSMANTHYDTSRSIRTWDDYLAVIRS